MSLSYQFPPNFLLPNSITSAPPLSKASKVSTVSVYVGYPAVIKPIKAGRSIKVVNQFQPACPILSFVTLFFSGFKHVTKPSRHNISVTKKKSKDTKEQNSDLYGKYQKLI